MVSIAHAALRSGQNGKTMRIDIITIFPHMFDSYFSESLIQRAREKKLLKIFVHNLRAFTKDKHKSVDDRPYGGGPGMVMAPQPLYDAIQAVKKKNRAAPVIYLTATGKEFNHKTARNLSKKKGLILVCGRYEGIDQRVIDLAVDMELSVGPYVLTGGELPAMIAVDAVSRFLPGFLGKKESLEEESFSPALQGKLEYPHYTRPEIFKGKKVPRVLLEGDHKKTNAWRKKHLR